MSNIKYYDFELKDSKILHVSCVSFGNYCFHYIHANNTKFLASSCDIHRILSSNDITKNVDHFYCSVHKPAKS